MLGPMPTARPLESLGMSQSHSLNAQTLSLNRPTACGLALRLHLGRPSTAKPALWQHCEADTETSHEIC